MHSCALPVRKPNAAYRSREHLTEREVERLIEAAKLANDGVDTAAIRHGKLSSTDFSDLGRRHGISRREACFVVRDHSGQALAYVYFEEEPGRQSAAKLLAKDAAWRIATIFWPELASYSRSIRNISAWIISNAERSGAERKQRACRCWGFGRPSKTISRICSRMHGISSDDPFA